MQNLVMTEEKNLRLGKNCLSQNKKTSQTCQNRRLYLQYCKLHCSLTMMQYVHCLRNLLN